MHWMKDKRSFLGREDTAGEVYCAGSVFFMEVARIYERGNKALIDWVGRSVLEYIALSLFRIDLPLVNQYRKGRGHYSCTDLLLS